MAISCAAPTGLGFLSMTVVPALTHRANLFHPLRGLIIAILGVSLKGTRVASFLACLSRELMLDKYAVGVSEVSPARKGRESMNENNQDKIHERTRRRRNTG